MNKINLIYYQYYDKPCKQHFVKNLEIIHNFDSKTNLFSINYLFKIEDLNLFLEIINTDIDNSIYCNELILNNKKIKLSNLKINKKIIKENNSATLFFNAKSKKEMIKEYVWFMCLVRYISYDWEEDEYFLMEEVKKRKECYDIINIFKIIDPTYIE